MSKLNAESRSALLSARAKNRKAAIALQSVDVTVPANVAKAMLTVEEWLNKTLEPAPKAEAKPAKAKKAKAKSKAKAKAAPEADLKKAA